jgi:Cupin-like domain
MLDKPTFDTQSAAPKLATVAGPDFSFVEEITWEELLARGDISPPTRPLLVKGAVKAWPAWQRWSFEKLAKLRRKDGGEVMASFQNGLVEQGVTKEPLIKPVAPYLQDLARQAAAPVPDDMGLLSARRRKDLKTGDTFKLDWSYMNSFKADKVYLAQWNILDEFPGMKKDFAITTVWSGWRWTWEFVFMGPAHTVTGIHYDFPNNWFCQVAGTKEFMLFPPDQSEHMCESEKFDWGATLSDINISKLSEQPKELADFEKAKGIYARVEAGDALFVPSKTWHCVVALEPSISLAVFGLTPSEIVIGGGVATARNALHSMRLYRWGNCTCHKMKPQAQSAA